MRRIMLLLALMLASTPAQGSTLLPGELFTPDSVFVVITAPVFADGTNRFCWHCDDGIPSNDLQLRPALHADTKNSPPSSTTFPSWKTSTTTAWWPMPAGRSSSAAVEPEPQNLGERPLRQHAERGRAALGELLGAAAVEALEGEARRACGQDSAAAPIPASASEFLGFSTTMNAAARSLPRTPPAHARRHRQADPVALAPQLARVAGDARARDSDVLADGHLASTTAGRTGS